jgi:hypothetical protein
VVGRLGKGEGTRVHRAASNGEPRRLWTSAHHARLASSLFIAACALGRKSRPVPSIVGHGMGSGGDDNVHVRGPSMAATRVGGRRGVRGRVACEEWGEKRRWSAARPSCMHSPRGARGASVFVPGPRCGSMAPARRAHDVARGAGDSPPSSSKQLYLVVFCSKIFN